MLYSEGRTFRFRAGANYKTPQERNAIFTYLKNIEAKVAAFDNTNVKGMILADFDTREARDEFHAKYNQPTRPVKEKTKTPILALVEDIKSGIHAIA